MNNLEIIKKDIDAVIVQGKQSVVWNTCRYRCVDEGGVTLKCAVGHLISDEHYSTDLENRTSDSGSVTMALEKSLDITIDGELQEALYELQTCHDAVVSEEDFLVGFRKYLSGNDNELIKAALEELGSLCQQ